jgi:hypothetical protein
MPYNYKGTNQFLAVPATDLFPTIYLLKFLSVEDFFITQLIVAYSLGFLGCLWFKKKYQWSLVSFVAFFLLFNFNGHITSHLAVGHWSWIAYFLLPFFVGWVLSLVEGDASGSRPIKLTLVLFGILLFGGLHPFVWCLLFLLLLGLFQKRYWKPILIGVALALVFSTYRILPAVITFWGYNNRFFSGFPSISVFWKALVYVQGQENMITLDFGKHDTAPWWEVDHYIGIIGLAAIAYFGLFLRWKKGSDWNVNDHRILNGPILILTVFSFYKIYGWISILPIPLITVERVSSRFFIIPLLFLLVFSCIWMQAMFNRSSPGWRAMLLAMAGIFCEGYLLLGHSQFWQVAVWEDVMSKEGIVMIDPVSDWAKSVEGYYIPTVQISYLISLTAILAFVAGYVYFYRKARKNAA